jgi:hypothetical protein
MLGLRTAVLLAAAATAAGLALPASSQAAGWRCNAGALTGSVLGQALPGAVSTGSTTADCTTGQATNPLSVPPLLDVGTLAASTRAAGTTALATGGVVNLALHSSPSLPITLPEITVPESLSKISVTVPLGIVPVPTLVEVDLTPAINALLPNRKLPSLDLLNVAGAVAYADGQCSNGQPKLGGTAQVGDITVAGQKLGTGSIVDKTLTLLDTGSIRLSDLDLTLAKVTLLGVPVTVDTSTLLSALQPVLGTEPLVVIPPTLAQVKVTPGDQTTADGLLIQRALHVTASIAGQSIADLAVGQAAIANGGVDCSAASAPQTEQPQTATDLALACTKRKIVLIDVLRRGDHVRLIGAADKQFVGRTVSIKFLVGHKTVAKAKVRKDGSFATTAPLPAAAIRGTNRARYQAVLGSERSLNLKLTRRMIVDSVTSSGGKVRIKGRVTRPLASPVQQIVVKRRVTCSKTVIVARVKPSPSGRFSVAVKAPKDQLAAVYRLSTRVRNTPGNPKLYPTFTLPRAVDL